MTEQKSPEPRYASSSAPVHGVLAEFDDVTTLTRACEQVRDAGYTQWDAHTPFPVHGLDAAMGIRATRLPWAVLFFGLTGLSLGLLMECWMMGVDYKFNISGKPLISLPAFVPVAFELTVLLSGFTCFFGSLALNKLPKFFSPQNLVPEFRRVTDDRFFIYVEAKDKLFALDKTKALLAQQKPLSLNEVRYESQGLHTGLPAGTVGVLSILALLSLFPFAFFARARERTSPSPRMHPNPPAPIKDDMDMQYKFKPQATNWFFADGRAMRNFPEGAVADEDPVDDTPFYSGRKTAVQGTGGPLPTAPEIAQPAPRGKATQQGKQHAAAHTGAVPPLTPSVPEQPGFVTTLPAEVDLTDTTMARGKQRFEIYCSTCHGYSGHGDGAVNRHAEALQEGTWVSPSNLHEERIRNLAVGDLFNTITHGVRNMPGYGHLIEPHDRWLIVAYVKALQRSLHASANDVPSDVRPTLQ